MEQVVEGVFSEEVDEDGEEALGLSHDLTSVDDVLLQHEPQDLNDLYPSCSQFWSAPRGHRQLLAALLHEVLEEFLELSDDGLIFWQDEGHTGEVGEQDGCIVNGDVFFLADDVFDDLRDDIKGEEDIVELGDLVVALEVGCCLLDDLADVG